MLIQTIERRSDQTSYQPKAKPVCEIDVESCGEEIPDEGRDVDKGHCDESASTDSLEL